jgi:hypothetical protein
MMDSHSGRNTRLSADTDAAKSASSYSVIYASPYY